MMRTFCACGMAKVNYVVGLKGFGWAADKEYPAGRSVASVLVPDTALVAPGVGVR